MDTPNWLYLSYSMAKVYEFTAIKSAEWNVCVWCGCSLSYQFAKLVFVGLGRFQSVLWLFLRP